MVGVDLGGTNVRAQAMYADGTEAGPRYENPSRAQHGTQAILDSVVSTVTQAAENAAAKPEAIGLAIPGHIDNHTGIVRWSPNFGETVDGVFHQWFDVPVRAPIERGTGLPVRMANDANCAALGEYMYGSGRGEAKCLVLLTLGTGVGGGVVMGSTSLMGDARGPQLLIGGNQGGAELGHTLIRQGGADCNAGSYGALEAYCQRDSIIKRAIHRLNRGRQSIIWDMIEGDLSKVTPKLLSEAADQGDFVARDVWREVGEALGAGIGSLMNVFAPDIFAIGGQISKAGQWLLEPAIIEARYIAIPSLYSDCRIVVAEQNEDAGLLGSAAIALELKR